ncbi:MAG TPA: hypothetical protein VME41_07905, partial [Stellaceae bacterium]|nr:hypothetical protein [Stellaceae bacterium]
MRRFAGPRIAVETVHFAGRPPVRILRGGAAAAAPAVVWTEHTETVRFGAGAGRVTIVRGGSVAPPPRRRLDRDPRRNVEIVRFADPRLA